MGRAGTVRQVSLQVRLVDGETIVQEMVGQHLAVPSVFGRNLQCQPVRGVDFLEECHWSHACSLQANMRRIQWHPRV
jgi:hypothetical protein